MRWLWIAAFVLPSLTTPVRAGAQSAGNTSDAAGDSIAPVPRAFATMAFDASPWRQMRLLMFGGLSEDSVYGAGASLADTWAWDGTVWQLVDAQGPPNSDATMVYDDVLGQLLLITQPTDSSTDPRVGTWQWDGSAWQDLQPNTSPPAGLWSGAAYDPDNGVIALAAPAPTTQVLPVPADLAEEMWAWNGTTWKQLHPVHMPPVSDRVALVYDPDSQQVIRQGSGVGPTPFRVADTWAWDGKDWTQLKPAHHPGVLQSPMLAFDPSVKRVALLGGTDSARECGTSTQRWDWDGQDWHNMGTTAHVTGRSDAALAYDDANSQLVLFGGCSGGANSPPGVLLQETNVLPAPTGVVSGRYVAMGDSFSAGEGVPPFIDGTDVSFGDDCHRSTRAYAQLLSRDLYGRDMPQSDFTACSGSTMVDVYLPNHQYGEEEPQIARLNKQYGEVGLVTLTMGGNNVQFANLISNCVSRVAGPCHDSQDGKFVNDLAAIDGTNPQHRDSNGTLEHMYQDIRRAAGPSARVLVAGYPHEFTLPRPNCSHVDGADLAWANTLADRLDDVIRRNVQAADANLEYVDVNGANNNLFEGHGLCGSSPAFNEFDAIAFTVNDVYSFHPNDLGQKLYEESFLRSGAWR